MIVIDELPKGSLCSGLKWVWEGVVILFLWDSRHILDNFTMERYEIYFFTGRTNTPALPLDPHMHCKAEGD